jgi:hypothetical protein
MSEGVQMPGAKGRLASRAAETVVGFMPGATAKAASASTAWRTWSGVRTVPRPASISGKARRMRRSAARAAGVRRVSSMARMPPAMRASATGSASSSRSRMRTAAMASVRS